MNAKSLAIAIALIAGTAVVSSVHAAPSITTLQTVQVRPDAEQLAQQAWERSSSIPTLAAVEVRPSLEQTVALAAEQQAERYTVALTNAATAFASNVIVNLPAVRVRPTQADLTALALETASVLVRP